MNESTYSLTNHFLTDAEKRELCSWKYAGKYEIYNLPDYDVMKAKQIGFMNPSKERNFYAFYDGDVLVGFVNILEEEKEVFIGIGVNPSHCGKRYGQHILKEAYAISKRLYPSKPLYLEVRTWNKRAINCYLKAGFEIDGEPFEQKTGSGLGTFYRMVKE